MHHQNVKVRRNRLNNAGACGQSPHPPEANGGLEEGEANGGTPRSIEAAFATFFQKITLFRHILAQLLLRKFLEYCKSVLLCPQGLRFGAFAPYPSLLHH